MDVSVIIVNYNTRELTSETIDSVFSKTRGITFELILVDNHSMDGSYEAFKDDERIKYLYLENNLGFGLANNKGIEIAKGRNIFLLNPDTILLNNAIKILSDYLDRNPKVGACGGNLFDKGQNAIHSFMRWRPGLKDAIDKIFGRRLSKTFYRDNFQFNYLKRPISVGHITGADLMIPRRVLEKVGLFHKDYFMYYEETDLCSRIAKAGFKIMSVPDAEIIHLVGQSFQSEDKIKKRESASMKGLVIYLKRNQSFPHHFISYILYQFYYSYHLHRNIDGTIKERFRNNKETLKGQYKNYHPSK